MEKSHNRTLRSLFMMLCSLCSVIINSAFSVTFVLKNQIKSENEFACFSYSCLFACSLTKLLMRDIRMEFQRQNPMECAWQKRNGSNDCFNLQQYMKLKEKRVTRHNENVRTAMSFVNLRQDFSSPGIFSFCFFLFETRWKFVQREVGVVRKLSNVLILF